MDNEVNSILKAIRAILVIAVILMVLGWAISSVVGLFGASISVMQVVAILVLSAVVIFLIAVLIGVSKR